MRDDAPESSDTVVRDSAGITIIETPGTRARAPIGWTVDTLPDLEIGKVEGDLPYLFSRIRGITAFPDGHILVVDEASRELRFFDRDGVFLYTRGGRGDGPGEFQRPSLIPLTAPDSIVVYDHRHHRFTVLDTKGEVLRVGSPVQVPGRQISGVAGVAQGRVLTSHTVYSMTGEPGLHPNPEPLVYRLTDPFGDNSVVFDTFPGPPWFTSVETADGISIGHEVPFHVLPAGLAYGPGVFVTKGDGQILDYEVSDEEINEAWTVTTRPARILRIIEPPRRVTEAEIDAFIAAHTPSESYADLLRRDYALVELPATIPVFQRLRMDSEGWLWAELYRYSRGGAGTWMVFDPSGQAHGTVETPPDLEVMHIARDFVLGRWRDELGVEYVRRHRFVRDAR